MKIIQISHNPQGNLIALSDDGIMYCGYFLQTHPMSKPVWSWREIPQPRPSEEYVYKRDREPSEDEIQSRIAEHDERLKNAFANAEKK